MNSTDKYKPSDTDKLIWAMALIHMMITFVLLIGAGIAYYFMEIF